MDIKLINPTPQEDIDYITDLYMNDTFYNQLETIGSGSMGEVFRYKNYAIKWGEDLNDGKILEQFQDSNLFPKLYFYHDDFIVMEYLEITHGYRYFERNVDIDFEGIDIFKYCYEKGYIPYDIHEENVIVTNNDEMKIVDVGSFIPVYSKLELEYYLSRNAKELSELDNIINHIKRPPIAI